MTTDPNKPAPAAPARPTDELIVPLLRVIDCAAEVSVITEQEEIAAHASLELLRRRACGDEGAMTGLIEAGDAWVKASDGPWATHRVPIAEKNLRDALDAAKRAGGA